MASEHERSVKEAIEASPGGRPNVLGEDHILQFLKYEHLPQHLQDISKPFADLAHDMCEKLPRNPERTVMLRKILEGKDAAVRARLAGIQG